MGKRKTEAEGGTKVARQRDPLLVAAGELARARRSRDAAVAKCEKLGKALAAAQSEAEAANDKFERAKAALTEE